MYTHDPMVDAILVPSIHRSAASLFGGIVPLGSRDILHGLVGFAISAGMALKCSSRWPFLGQLQRCSIGDGTWVLMDSRKSAMSSLIFSILPTS